MKFGLLYLGYCNAKEQVSEHYTKKKVELTHFRFYIVKAGFQF